MVDIFRVRLIVTNIASELILIRGQPTIVHIAIKSLIKTSSKDNSFYHLRFMAKPTALNQPRSRHCENGCFVFRTIVKPSGLDTTKTFGARTLFDTGSELNLVSRSFITWNGLRHFIKKSSAPQPLTAFGTWEDWLDEEIQLSWQFNGHIYNDIRYYIIDLPDNDFDLLLGGEFLHSNQILEVVERRRSANSMPKARVRATGNKGSFNLPDEGIYLIPIIQY